MALCAVLAGRYHDIHGVRHHISDKIASDLRTKHCHISDLYKWTSTDTSLDQKTVSDHSIKTQSQMVNIYNSFPYYSNKKDSILSPISFTELHIYYILLVNRD